MSQVQGYHQNYAEMNMEGVNRAHCSVELQNEDLVVGFHGSQIQKYFTKKYLY